MKEKALLWFTGVITQYSVEPNYHIDELVINNNLLKRLNDKYNLISIIWYRDDDELQAYKQLLVDNKIASKMQVLFITGNVIYDQFILQVLQQVKGITTYIDHDLRRLRDASLYIKTSNCLHISQLID